MHYTYPSQNNVSTLLLMLEIDPDTKNGRIFLGVTPAAFFYYFCYLPMTNTKVLEKQD